MIPFLCAAVLASQIVDATTFAAFFMLPGAEGPMEQNPVIRWLVEIGGVTLVVAVKLAWGYFIWRRAPRYRGLPRGPARRLMLTVLPIVGALTLTGAAFNTYSIIQVLP